MKVIDLFAGIGGFRYGLEAVSGSFEFVYSNEWDKYASAIYRKHYGEIDTTDIRNVKSEDIPEHDLLCAGFPCQSFSIAGRRKGFKDTRGTLFYEIARIARDKRVPFLFLENVKGLLNHDGGQTFAVIIESLDELGYDLQWQVLNSKNFGVPQNRERVFIIGHFRGQRRPEIFPITGKSGKDCQIIGRAMGIKGHDYLKRVYSPEGSSPTLPTGTGGNHEPKIGVAAQDCEIKEKKVATTLDANYHKGIDNHQARTGVMENMNIRKLTPTECERLQGFPDGYTTYGVDKDGNEIEISDTQRYKTLGNAVTTNVITAIGMYLYDYFKGQDG